jgi:hypothetical protein
MPATSPVVGSESRNVDIGVAPRVVEGFIPDFRIHQFGFRRANCVQNRFPLSMSKHLQLEPAFCPVACSAHVSWLWRAEHAPVGLAARSPQPLLNTSTRPPRKLPSRVWTDKSAAPGLIPGTYLDEPHFPLRG